MKADWESLGDEYASSSSVLIGDVDCTVETSLCSEQKVQGYPTIKYWQDGAVHDYNGGRTLAALKKHVQDNLERPCSIGETSSCTDKEKDFIAKAKAMDVADAKKQLVRLENMKGDKMTPALKGWLLQRINILKQVVA
jgi:protein disulfide-isomerase A6